MQQSNNICHYWRKDAGLVETISRIVKSKRVLEIFAGNGYLASCLEDSGVTITPTTLLSSHDGHGLWKYHNVIEKEASCAISELGNEHDILLICWPTVSDAALKAIEKWGPDKPIIYVGEMPTPWLGAAGMLQGCATDAFFDNFNVTETLNSYKTTNMMERAVVGYYSPRLKDK